MSVQHSPLRRLASESSTLPPGNAPSGPKAQILEAALRLFAERNYAGASMRDIADAVGLKPASLYSHYKSKELMLATLIEIGHRQHHDGLAAALADAGPEPVARLRAYVRAHVSFHSTYPMLATVINHELHALPSEVIRDALDLREQAVEQLSTIFTDGIGSGEFNLDHDPWLASAAIGAMGMRVADWFNDGHAFSEEQIISAYGDFALRIAGVRISATK